MADQISLALVVFTAAVALLHFINRWWNIHGGRKRSNNEENQEARLPPGSTGCPLIGESFSFYRSMTSNHPRKFIDDREKRYNSDIFISHLFGRWVVVSADPQFNKFVLQNEGRLFQAQYHESLKTLMGNYGVLSVHGDLQRKLHGIAVNLLRFERLRVDFMEEIQSLVHSTLDRWAEMKDIALQNECHQMILNLMTKQLLDLSPSKETTEICELFIDYTNATISIPIKIPGSTYAKGIKARQLLIRKISEMIEERRNHPQAVHNDLLAKLLEEGSLSDEIICDFILFLLFAGHETSSRALTFAIKFLTYCPEAVEQMQDVSNNVLFTPFGGGARLCPGYHLAKLELALFLHIFVTRFRWEALGNDRTSYFALPYLTEGFPIRLHCRQ